jgi:hypothetical protein
MASVLTKLSDKAYWRMRKAMVKEVYDSETHSIKCVAERHKISPSTLWGWVHQDLGPNQIKWLLEKSHKIRGQRISESAAGTLIKDLKNEMKGIMTVAKITAPKHKPWSKKKARIAAEQAAALPGAMKAMGITEDAPTFRDLVQETHISKDLRGTPKEPTIQPKVVSTLYGNRKQVGATIVINLDDQGKFIKYEVTGDASVQVFTRNK